MDPHAWNDRAADTDLVWSAGPTRPTAPCSEEVHRSVTADDGDRTAIDSLVLARKPS